MKRILIVAAIGLFGLSQTATATGGYATANIDVMTMNQYLGADLDPIIEAVDPTEFNEAVVMVLEEAAANDFPSRAGALAKIITRRLPELVGLQEVVIFTCMDLDSETPNEAGCETPRIRNAFNDHLELTLEAIAEQGADYVQVATVVNFNTSGVIVPPSPLPGIPFVIDGYSALVNIVDRDVTLVRSDLESSATAVDYTVFQPDFCQTPSANGCNYEVVVTATLPDGTPDGTEIRIERGFVGVDVTVDGTDYRFVNTHLGVQRPDGTDLSSIFQAAQAQELIETLGATTPSNKLLIVVGDINSSPDDPIIVVPDQVPPDFPSVIVPPYTQFVMAGYTDAWMRKRINKRGYTCCQDKDLLNRRSELDERIDVIFSLDNPWRVRRARVLGARFWNKTRPPGPRLWPSDHASVAAELRF